MNWIDYYIEDCEWLKTDWLKGEKLVCESFKNRKRREWMMKYMMLHIKNETLENWGPMITAAYPDSELGTEFPPMLPFAIRVAAKTMALDIEPHTPKPNTEVLRELSEELRKKTGMSLMDCKKCLGDNSWSLHEAQKNWEEWYAKRTKRTL